MSARRKPGESGSTSNDAAQTEIQEAAQLLSRVAKRAIFDETYREELMRDQVNLLRAAGMSLIALTKLQCRMDVTDDELQRFSIVLDEADDHDGTALKLTNFCVGTCKNPTIFICAGCTNSFLTAG